LKVFDPVARNSIKLDSKRMKELNKLKGQPIPGEEWEVIEDDNYKMAKVYEVKRDLLRLNPNNGRFGSARARLIRLRRKAGIKNPAVFNMDDDRQPNIKDRKEKYYDPETKEEPMGGDVNQIRNMIKGLYPIDQKKKTAYEKLKKGMKNHGKIKNSNGQKDAGIVLADGTYVNANRRDCVLDELWRNSKSGNIKYTKIRVAICDPATTASDVDAMEMHEQESEDFREPFLRIDQAKKAYKYYIEKCRENSLPEKVKGKWQDKIVKLTHSWVEGKEEKITRGSLNLYILSNLILKKVGRGKIKKDDLWRISTDDNEEFLSCSVSEILGDGGYADAHYNAESAAKKEKILDFAVGLVQNVWYKYSQGQQGKVFVQEMKKYGHREVRYSKMKPVMEDSNNTIGKAGYGRGKEVGSEAYRKQFDKDLAQGVNKTSDRKEVNEANEFLKNIEGKLNSMQEKLEEKTGGPKAANILKEKDGIDRAKDCVATLLAIIKLIKSKSSPRQKPKPIIRKKSKKGKKRGGKKRLNAGRHSRR
jgi:hypothetical protein